MLFIGAHMDDIELGCGATINRFSQHWHCYGVSMTCPGPELGNHLGSLQTTIKSILGLQEYWVDPLMAPFWKRVQGSRLSFGNSTVQMERYLSSLCDQITPDFVFCIDGDRHPDHQMVQKLVSWRFPNRLAFFRPHRIEPFEVNFRVQVLESDLQAKLDAVEPYREVLNRPYMAESIIRATAVMDGYGLPAGLAEGFRLPSVVV